MINRPISQAKVFEILFGIWVVSILSMDQVKAQTVRYIHTDGLGSVVLVTSQNRGIIERREYEPYGLVLSGFPDGPSYTGHFADSGTGLYYMQQRYYDPAIGRFISTDPIYAGLKTGKNFNRYWYANNSPYNHIDPDGRATIAVGPSAGAIAIGGVTISDQYALSFPSANPATWRFGRLVQFGGQAGTNSDVGVNLLVSYSDADSVEEMAGNGPEASAGGSANLGIPGIPIQASIGLDRTICSGCKATTSLAIGPKLGLLPVEVHSSVTWGVGITLLGRSPLKIPTVTVGAPVQIHDIVGSTGSSSGSIPAVNVGAVENMPPRN